MYLATSGGRILARRLLQIGAVKFARPDEPGWRLKLHETKPDAPLSPFYFNLRTPDNPKPGPLNPDILNMVATAFEWVVDQQGVRFSAVCGIPNAGTPIAQAFVLRRLSKALELQKTGDDASGRRISGVKGWAHLGLGSHVLLIDDVITGADTKIEAVEAICSVACEVSDLFVIVDREQGGVAELEKSHHVRTHSLFGVHGLLLLYLHEGLIEHTAYDRAMAYLRQEATTRDPIAHV